MPLVTSMDTDLSNFLSNGLLQPVRAVPLKLRVGAGKQGALGIQLLDGQQVVSHSKTQDKRVGLAQSDGRRFLRHHSHQTEAHVLEKVSAKGEACKSGCLVTG